MEGQAAKRRGTPPGCALLRYRHELDKVLVGQVCVLPREQSIQRTLCDWPLAGLAIQWRL